MSVVLGGACRNVPQVSSPQLIASLTAEVPARLQLQDTEYSFAALGPVNPSVAINDYVLLYLIHYRALAM